MAVKVNEKRWLQFAFVLVYCLVITHSVPLTSDFAFEQRKVQSDEVHAQIKQDFALGILNFVTFARDVHQYSALQDHQKSALGKKLTVKCSACVLLVNYEMWKIKNKTDVGSMSNVVSWIEKGCEYFKLETPPVCQGGMKIFGQEIVTVFSKLNLPAEEICGIWLPDLCTNFHHINSATLQWTVPIPEEVSARSAIHRRPAPKESRLKVLHLSDLHVDMQYKVGATVDCDEPVCCRKIENPEEEFTIMDPLSGKSRDNADNSTRRRTHGDAAMKWGDYHNCDLPWWTLDNLLRQLSEENARHPIDYVIFTGDIPAHDVWAQTREEQLRIIYNVTSMMTSYFKGTPVYPAVGNHESFPSNNFPPEEIVTGSKFKVRWLYNALAEAWSTWLPEDALETVKRGGYYTALIRPGFRIVSLNTNFCYSENVWIWLDPQDPAGMLTWFAKVLTEAEKVGELVHVIGHVPPGREPECLHTWSENYFRILERFRNTISAQFFGHTHYDEIELFYGAAGKVISTAYLAPSVTTYIGMKPAYRFYEIDAFTPHSTWSVLNHRTYVLDLEKANATDNPVWELEYDACKAYNSTILSNEMWDNFLRDWVHYLQGYDTKIPVSLVQYAKYYYKDAPNKYGPRCNTARCIRNLICDVGKNVPIQACYNSDEEDTSSDLRFS